MGPKCEDFKKVSMKLFVIQQCSSEEKDGGKFLCSKRSNSNRRNIAFLVKGINNEI